jgi:hypothetical protein
METICYEADAHGVTLFLEVEPFGGGLNEDQLAAFSRRACARLQLSRTRGDCR